MHAVHFATPAEGAVPLALGQFGIVRERRPARSSASRPQPHEGLAVTCATPPPPPPPPSPRSLPGSSRPGAAAACEAAAAAALPVRCSVCRRAPRVPPRHRGFCAATEGEGDCAAGQQGAWELGPAGSTSGVRDLAGCMVRRAPPRPPHPRGARPLCAPCSTSPPYRCCHNRYPGALRRVRALPLRLLLVPPRGLLVVPQLVHRSVASSNPRLAEERSPPGTHASGRRVGAATWLASARRATARSPTISSRCACPEPRPRRRRRRAGRPDGQRRPTRSQDAPKCWTCAHRLRLPRRRRPLPTATPPWSPRPPRRAAPSDPRAAHAHPTRRRAHAHCAPAATRRCRPSRT